jgi:putative heme-binding domain-containing protein
VKWEPLPRQPTEVLLDHLIGDNLWAREQARVVLRQRLSAEIAQTKAAAKATGQLVLDDDPTRVTTAMERWYQTDKAPAKLREVCLLEANFSTTGWSRFGALLESPDPRLRALVPRFMAALRSRRLFRASPPPPPAPKPAEGSQPSPRLANLYALPRLAADADPRVRLETLRTLARYRTPQSIDLVLNSALKTAGDPFLEFAAWQTMNDLAQPWTDSILKEEWKIEGREAQLDYGLNAIDPALAGVTLAKLLADGKIALNQGPWIELVGRAGGPAELAALFESLIISYGADCCPGRNMTAPRATSLDEPKAQRALAALLEAVRVRNVRPEGELALAALAAHAPEPLRAGFVRLAGYWKTQDAPEFLPALATTAETRPELRLAAIEGLRALGGPAAIRALETVCTSEQPFGLRRSALLALAAQKFPAAAPLLAPILRTAPNENEVLATWRQLLAVQGAAGALEKQFSDAAWVKDLPPPVVMAAFRAARESGKKGQTLTQVLAPLVGASAAPVFTAEDYQRLAAAARVSGDPAQGELLYRQTASGCTTCHAIGGAGGMVGPALTSIGASAPLDYIIESMLAPNAKVKEGYNAVALKLRDGTEATGIQARETAQEVILRNIAGQETAVPKAAITGKTDVGSIMPAGLLEQFSERDRLNLYAFLGELGKPGPYDASKGSVARVWRLYSAAQEAQALKQDVTGFVPPVYTQVDGRLTQTALSEALPMIGDAGKDFYATAQFQVAAGGKVRLNFTGISTAWLDGQPLAIASEPSPAPELTPGVHTLTVKLDRTALPAVLRAEAPGANFLGN